MKATIYFQNTFGVSIARNVRLHGVRSGKDYQSSFDNKLVLTYIPKGKRKPVAARFDGAVYIAKGWQDSEGIDIKEIYFLSKTEKPEIDLILSFSDDLVLTDYDDSLKDLKQFDISKLKQN